MFPTKTFNIQISFPPSPNYNIVKNNNTNIGSQKFEKCKDK